MGILRVIHASELPDPGALIEKLTSGEAVGERPAAEPAGAVEQGALLKLPETFAELVEKLGRTKAHVSQQLHDFVGLVRYAPPELVIRPTKPLSGNFAREVADALKEATGTAWQVRASDEEAEPSLLDQEKEAAERLRREVLETPLVKAAFEAFPEAELAGFRLDEPRSA